MYNKLYFADYILNCDHFTFISDSQFNLSNSSNKVANKIMKVNFAMTIFFYTACVRMPKYLWMKLRVYTLLSLNMYMVTSRWSIRNRWRSPRSFFLKTYWRRNGLMLYKMSDVCINSILASRRRRRFIVHPCLQAIVPGSPTQRHTERPHT